MAKVAIGDDASIMLPTGTVIKTDSFAYTNDRRLVNTTGFEDGEWDTFESGGRSAGLVFSGHPKYDDATTDPDLTLSETDAQEYTLTFAPGCTVLGDFVKYRSAITADKKTSQLRISVLAQQTGDATSTWDEATV